MANIEQRMEMIDSSIIAQARAESRGLIEKANYEREHVLALFEEQVVQEMFDDVQKRSADIRKETVRAISAARSDAKQAVLKKRGELADTVFTTVREKLAAYTNTKEYLVSILGELNALCDAYPHTATTVFLRKSDMGIAGEIEDALKGAKVEADSSIRIGGWKLRNSESGILLDETLDSKLSNQREWFLTNSGMQL